MGAVHRSTPRPGSRNCPARSWSSSRRSPPGGSGPTGGGAPGPPAGSGPVAVALFAVVVARRASAVVLVVAVLVAGLGTRFRVAVEYYQVPGQLQWDRHWAALPCLDPGLNP